MLEGREGSHSIWGKEEEDWREGLSLKQILRIEGQVEKRERGWRKVSVREPEETGLIEEGSGLRPVDLDTRNAMGYRLIKGFSLLQRSER